MTESGTIRPIRLRCEYLRDPLGLDVVAPRLSWVLESGQRGQKQTAYRVLVASAAELLAKDDGDLWDSGRVESDRTIQVEYAGKSLVSRMRCCWKVRVWDRNGRASAWSEPACWSMGLLAPSDWQAQWIGYRDPASPPVERSEPWLRKAVIIAARARQATAYVCSIGYHELYVNGHRIGDAMFSPAVSQLDRRALYVTYDITEYMVEGRNVIGLWLGNGWFRHAQPGLSNQPPSVMAQIEWLRPDGALERIVTDQTWKAHPSPWSVTGLLAESYDATREVEGWCGAGFDDGSWRAATMVSAPPVILSAQKVQPNRVADSIHPVAISEPSPGVYEIDMGRNYVGHFELRIRAARGDRIEMEMNEVELGSGRKQGFGQHDVYIAKGVDGETFRHRFDYRAFRYVTVRGLRRPPVLDDARGFLIHADLGHTATFECSNALFNRIQRTVDWTYRCVSMGGNIVDCPHRERLGYGAEGQTTMLTAMTHSDAAAMFTHWLEVWRDIQDPVRGMLPHTAPGNRDEGSPGWGGICVTLPWQLYLRYGDRRILEQSYPSIRKWIDFLDSESEGDLLRHYGDESLGFYADWVAPGRQIGGRWTNAVPKECDLFFNNCYFIHNIAIAGEIARVLGKEEDARRYDEEARKKRRAVHAAYYDVLREVYVNGEQAYQAISLWAGVIPDGQRAQLSNLLALLIVEGQKGHLNTGVLGTFFLLECLLQENRNDLIFQMVNQRTFPGWGWLLDQGATTIGEQWGGLASQIHSSFLSINSWFIEGIGGIRMDPDGPGYERITIRPAVVGDLTWANTSYDSIRGPIVSRWTIADGRFELEVEVPANTTATVHVPACGVEAVREGGRPAATAEGVASARLEGDRAVFEIGSGRYHFETELQGAANG